MSDSVHPAIDNEGDRHEVGYDNAQQEKEARIEQLRKYEEQVERHREKEGLKGCDTVAHTTMLNGGRMSDEPWDGEPDAEIDNIVQEELYVHGKVCIVDDRIAICGSANINDRVSLFHSPLAATYISPCEQPN